MSICRVAMDSNNNDDGDDIKINVNAMKFSKRHLSFDLNKTDGFKCAKIILPWSESIYT